MDKKQLEKMCDKIVTSEFFHKYGYKTGTALIIIYDCYAPAYNHIEINLSCDTLRGIKKALDKLVRELGSELVSNHYVCKYDGSCPNAAKIWFK